MRGRADEPRGMESHCQAAGFRLTRGTGTRLPGLGLFLLPVSSVAPVSV